MEFKYNKLKLPEAMSAYFEPAICKVCGGKIGVIKGQTRRDHKKRKLCPNCAKLYDMAYNEVKRREKRSGRYKFTNK